MKTEKKTNPVRLSRIWRKWLPAIVFAACCIAFLVYFVMTRGVGDHKAPEITVPQTPLQISVHDEKQALLSGITAEDHHDGDVTASLVVESVSGLYDGNRATVTVAAFDEANNVAKAQRTVEYTDYRKPHFTLSGPMIFAEGGADKVFNVIGAEDVLDEQLDDRVKGTLVEGETALDKAGMYQVEFRVTNSLGDTVHQTLPVEIVTAKENGARLELTDYLVYLKTGDSFSPRSYLKSEDEDEAEEEEKKDEDEKAEDEDGEKPARKPARKSAAPTRSVDIESDVDTSTPGTYTVTYTDESKNPLKHTRLIVIVEE